MIWKKGVITAAVLSAAVVFAEVFPSGASSSSLINEIRETELETETELGVLDGGDGSLLEVLTSSYDLALSVDFEEPIQSEISSALKNIDMSWLRTASLTGQSTGNEKGGLDASLLLNLNGADLYHGQIGIDLSDKKIYVACPEFQKKAILIDLSGETGEAERAETADQGKKSSKKKKPKPIEIAALCAHLAGTLSQTDAREWAGLFGKIFPYIAANAKISQNENATVLAGGLADLVLANTIRLDQAQVADILEKVMPLLLEDELVQELLSSQSAVELVKMVRKAEGLSTGQVDGEWILDAFEDSVNKALEGGKSSIPGISLTYGFDAEGRLAELDLNLLYGAYGALMANVFTFRSIEKENWNACEFCPGQLLSSVLVSKTVGNVSQQTGLYMEGETEDGLLHESVRLMIGGQSVASFTVSDLDLDVLKKGVLSCSLSLQLGKVFYSAELEKDGDTEVISLKKNDTPYLTLRASANRIRKAKVSRIDRKSAVTVTDKSSWQAYVADSHLTKMIIMLAGGSVPGSIIESLTSGEAGTEAARENKVEGEEDDEEEVVAQGAEMGLDREESSNAA